MGHSRQEHVQGHCLCLAEWVLEWFAADKAAGFLHSMALQAKRNFWHRDHAAALWWHCGFYKYYQIGSDDEDDEPETGSGDTGELIQTGMHSPWGTIYQIVKETGWSWHYVLWKVSRLNIMLMMADRPGFRRGKKVKRVSSQDMAAHYRAKYGSKQ